MKRGKQGERKIDPKFSTDMDLAQSIPQMLDYIEGKRDTLSAEGFPEVQIPQLCTFMEAIVLKAPRDQLKGKIDDLNKRVAYTTTVCSMYDFADGRILELIDEMHRRGELQDEPYLGWKSSYELAAKRHHKETVALTVQLFLFIRSMATKRPANRPRGSQNSNHEFDRQIIHESLKSFEMGPPRPDGEGTVMFTKNMAVAAIRAEVALALKDGRLKPLGTDENESCANNLKRILRQFDNMLGAAENN
jgi:hypothetical protein